MTDGTMAPTVRELEPMTPDEFRQWYERLRAIDPTLTHASLARRLGVDQPRIGKWLRDEVKISGYLWRALEHLEAELERERRPARRRPKQLEGDES